MNDYTQEQLLLLANLSNLSYNDESFVQSNFTHQNYTYLGENVHNNVLNPYIVMPNYNEFGELQGTVTVPTPYDQFTGHGFYSQTDNTLVVAFRGTEGLFSWDNLQNLGPGGVSYSPTLGQLPG